MPDFHSFLLLAFHFPSLAPPWCLSLLPIFSLTTLLATIFPHPSLSLRFHPPRCLSLLLSSPYHPSLLLSSLAPPCHQLFSHMSLPAIVFPLPPSFLAPSYHQASPHHASPCHPLPSPLLATKLPRFGASLPPSSLIPPYHQAFPPTSFLLPSAPPQVSSLLVSACILS